MKGLKEVYRTANELDYLEMYQVASGHPVISLIFGARSELVMSAAMMIIQLLLQASWNEWIGDEVWAGESSTGQLRWNEWQAIGSPQRSSRGLVQIWRPELCSAFEKVWVKWLIR